MKKGNFSLRLQPSLMEEARKAAESEGMALNQLINVAVAEKVSALRTEEFFQERIRRANRVETLRILGRAGKGNSPMEGDELPPDWPQLAERAGEQAGTSGKSTPQSGKIKRRRRKIKDR
jgi:hypothetical protein